MKVLITGGSGFLGRAILTYGGKHEYTVYSRDERKQELCARTHFGKYAKYILGDIRDRDRLLYNFREQDLVIHAAAVKYIPEAERNVNECIDVNVEGSRNVLWAARHTGVRVVGVSTDKAVQPVNVYGATKMLMERAFAEAARDGLRCWCVRYGNVVGSTGSVIPFFIDQLKLHKPLTLTDPNMTRYWMSASQAVSTVLAPLNLDATPGSVIVPEIGATDLRNIAMWLQSNHGDYGTQVVGLRPGEKTYESLIHEHESHKAYRLSNQYWAIGEKELHKDIFSLRSDTAPVLTNEELDSMLQEGMELAL
jgi:UDP-N-acetylglucosamine 4,6-dehydratase